MADKPSRVRRLEDLRHEAAAAAQGLQGGEHALLAALGAFEAENERVAETPGLSGERRRGGLRAVR